MDWLAADIWHAPFWLAVGQIIWIDILLAGDNAVVIALACRSLQERQRVWGMIFGAGAAVLLRVFFTLIVSQALAIPYLKLVGGLLLLWIAVKLLVPEDDDHEGKVQAGDTLWRAVMTIVIADIVMSLDNVIAIAATAETASARVDVAHAETLKMILIVFGLAASIPLVVAGSALLMSLIERFPILIWAGAGLLGWVAGEIITKDTAVANWLGADFVAQWHYATAAAGVVFVLATGAVLRRLRAKEPVEL